ncbi:hypothetical protein [Catellatospora sichuanensis]|uniref:hypothetical protein n=1 Tax=Catellatospora sichuanensis TaxID=1969805 RepID=UPI0011839FD3|nr:hypothetical protein [Catellatospora sichuanensis]
MKSIDKTPFWAWPLGIFGCAGPVAFTLVVDGRWIALPFLAVGMAYAAGLGRALLRRNLVARGVGVDA